MKKITQRHLLIANVIFWITLAALYVLQNYASNIHSEKAFSWFRLLGYYLPFNLSLIFLSIPVYLIHYRLKNTSLLPKISIHLLAGLLFGFIHVIVYFSIMSLFRDQMNSETQSFIAFIKGEIYYNYPRMISSAILYGFVILVLTFVDFYNKYLEEHLSKQLLENKLTTTQLQALRMQLQPHFLFNAFNTISMMVIREKNEEAVDMIAGLSELLRSSLSQEEKQFISLREEMNFIKKYLAIEKIRFKDRLTINFNIEEKTNEIKIPNLILQPVLENAFKHGISKTLDEAVLEINAKIERDILTIDIFNNGPTLAGNWDINKNKGIGLHNVLERLDKLYQYQYDFDLKNIDDKGVKVILKLPVL